MSYFKGIEFEGPAAPKPPTPITRYDGVKVAAAVEKIQAELEKVRVGSSEHTSYAIEPGRFGFTILSHLNAFLTSPTENARARVEQIAEQDLGARFAEFVQVTLEETKETTNV